MNRYLVFCSLIFTISVHAQDTASSKKTSTQSYMRYFAAFSLGVSRAAANSIGAHYTSEKRIGQSEFQKNTLPLRFVTFSAVHAIHERNRPTPLPDICDLWALGIGEVVGDVVDYNYITPGRPKFHLRINENLLLAAGTTLLRPIIKAYTESHDEKTNQK